MWQAIRERREVLKEFQAIQTVRAGFVAMGCDEIQAQKLMCEAANMAHCCGATVAECAERIRRALLSVEKEVEGVN